MRRARVLRRIGLGCALAVALVASQGCTTWKGGVAGFLKNRVKDAMECADFGITVSEEPQFSFYAALLSVAPCGYGKVDGKFYGMGGGDFGAMDIHYEHWGAFIVGHEITGWGNSLWDFPEFDPTKPETMNCQGVGIVGFVKPPPEARPAGRPT